MRHIQMERHLAGHYIVASISNTRVAEPTFVVLIRLTWAFSKASSAQGVSLSGFCARRYSLLR
jgi:hypothetical protein